MARRKIHMICNAHMDPVWLWQWPEGAAAGISTFRAAADFCEERDNFIFCHNEVILYKWVEEYEPELFERIRRLVKAGKWQVIGGWYLQPDCNMPSGESFVRQALLGRDYFREKFGVMPTVAINFDSFGHTRGLVQILAKSGYNAYIHCRPDQGAFKYPDDAFAYIWTGLDGSEVMASRAGGYCTGLGKARAATENFMAWIEKQNWWTDGRDFAFMLWGVGNHGGGPSRKDLDDLAALDAEDTDKNYVHSTPEAYFADLAKIRGNLKRIDTDMTPFAVGCYTSQIRIKQMHRRLENDLYATEKMFASASLQNILPYPKAELHEVMCDLATSEFHDILPGSSIQPAEDDSLQMLSHGLEIIARLKTRAFFALSAGQPKAAEGEYPILVYNPHPFKVKTIVTCEFQLADQNWTEKEFTMPTVYDAKGRLVASQCEKECANLPLDWRKQMVFETELEPGCVNRFDCRVEVLKKGKPAPKTNVVDGKLTFTNDAMTVVINTKTGLVDSYIVGGVERVRPGACCPIAITDNIDPWGMTVDRFRDVAGTFKLMSPKRAAWFAGIQKKSLAPVRVIEDGAARVVVEALFEYGDSFICQHYQIPKHGSEIGVQVRVIWNEKNTMLKWSVPTSLTTGRYIGQTAFGHQPLKTDGAECVAQKWVMVTDDAACVSIINDSVYGSDCCDGEIRMSLLRSAAYSGHPIAERVVMPQDRFMPRIDQGERLYNFWLNAGEFKTQLEKIDRRALVHNEKPFSVSFFPPGLGTTPKSAILLSDEVVQLVAFKQASSNDDIIVRLLEPTGMPRSTTVTIPALDLTIPVSLKKFEAKTLRIDRRTKQVTEVNLVEMPLS